MVAARCKRGKSTSEGTNGLFRSLDDGVHWTRCSRAGGTFVEALDDGQAFIGPTLARELFHVDDQCEIRSTATLPSSYNSQPPFGALMRLPTGRLLASRWSIGLFVSDDAGSGWRQVPLPPTAQPDWILSFGILPSGHVVAASNASILRSTDNGDTWVRGNEARSFHGLAVSRSGVLLGYGAGIWKSSDEGVTWQRVGLTDQTVWAVVDSDDGVGPSATRTLLAAVQRQDRFDNDIRRSTDGGTTWVVTGPPRAGRVNVLLQTRNGAILAGTSTGFFRSGDGGNTWQFQGVSSAAMRVMAASPDGVVVGSTPGEWVSHDDGHTWAPTLMDPNEANHAQGPNGTFSRALLVDHEGRIFGGGQNGVIVSRDRGATWTRVGLHRDTAAIAQLADGKFLAATSDGIFRSSDRGDTWIERSIGLTEFMATGFTTMASGAVIAATLHQAFLSTNAGDTWLPLTGGWPYGALRPVLATGIAPVTVAALQSTLYEWVGNSWKPALVVHSPITSMSWDTAGRLWIGTRDDGILVARPGKSRWSTTPVVSPAASVLGVVTTRGGVVVTTTAGVYTGVLPR